MLSGRSTIPERSLVRRILAFALVGAVGTLAHYSILTALVEIWHVPVLVAATTGFAVGAIVNYGLSRRLVFRSGASHSFALPRFLTVAALGAVANLLVVGWLTGLGLHYLLAQICATGAVLFCNFTANQFWTFRR